MGGDLWEACQNGEVERLRLLIQEGDAPVDRPQEDGEYPLFIASKQGNAECVQLLLEAGAALEQPRKGVGTPLHIAGHMGHTECVKLLLNAGADSLRVCPLGWTPQRAAVMGGGRVPPECLELIASAEDDARRKTEVRARAAVALLEEEVTDDVEQLSNQLRRGGDINAKDMKGRTPLAIASLYGCVECVKLLLAEGADINSAAEDGTTPLYIASAQGCVECAKLLLIANALIDQPQLTGGTPLLIACQTGRPSCVSLLIEANATIDRAPGTRRTPLCVASMHGQIECVTLLLAANACVDETSEDGATPLFLACSQGQTECVKMLLASNAAIDQTLHSGASPLLVACQQRSLECVRLLLDASAQVTPDVGKIVGTPLHIACNSGQTECVQLLLDAQADALRICPLGWTPQRAAVEGGGGVPPECLKLIAAAEDEARRKAEARAETAMAALLEEEEQQRPGVQGGSKKVTSSKGKARLLPTSRKVKGGAASALGSLARTPSRGRSTRSTLSSSRLACSSSKSDDGASSRADGALASEDGLPRSAAAASADEALKLAMQLANESADPQPLITSLDKHRAAASEPVVSAARLVRDRIKEKRKQASLKQRKSHASVMQSLGQLQSANEVSAIRAAVASAERHIGTMPALDLELASARARLESMTAACPSAALGSSPRAVRLGLEELSAATEGFSESRLVGSGGFSQVYQVAFIPSIPQASVPRELRHLPLAIKRATSVKNMDELADLQREVTILQDCHHPSLLRLLGYCLDKDAACLVFPLMLGGSFADRLWPDAACGRHLNGLGIRYVHMHMIMHMPIVPSFRCDTP